MDALWAKHDGPDEWHPLVAHSADVAALMERLLRDTNLGARMARLLGQDFLSEEQLQRFCVLAALHDAGKTNRGFQDGEAGHVRPIIGMLSTAQKKRKLTEILSLREVLPWFDGQWKIMFDWLQTTWSHHGAPVRPERPGKGLWMPTAIERLSAFKEWTRQWYPDAFQEAKPIARPEAQHLFNGILTLADWIASDKNLLCWKPSLTDPEEAITAARERRAPDAIRDLHLAPDRNIDSSLWTILDGDQPYDVQEAIQDLPTHPNGTLSVLESATGSGKTEGALGRYARLLENGLVDSMYFAVPTRAAAKQLHERIEEARDFIFGKEGPPVHLAVPGYLKVDDREGTRFSRFGVRWDEDIGARGWAAESSKRYTASPIAVGTVDQVLMSILKRKHAHLRLAGLARSFLVVDEVHASSVYMNELLQKVLSFHRQMGGHALLMSATLGSKARADFTGEDVPTLNEAKGQHYPRLSHVNGSAITEPKKPKAPTENDKEVSLELEGIAEAPEAIARCAEDAARDGAHVLVIRNTVKACQQLFEKVDKSYSLHLKTDIGPVPTPHHSRYCAADREKLDAEIEHVYGKHEEGEGDDKRIVRKTDGGVITIATQTVEQSLDIDADLLITDLCPMDVLLQRIGRLHRHDREGRRPDGCETARCVVLTPATGDLKQSISPETGKGHPGPGLGSVYSDLRILEATWQVLKQREQKEIAIPEHNRMLVEQATHPSVLASMKNEDPRWEAHAQYLKREKREKVLGAKNAQIDRSQQLTADDNQFPDTQPKTRLGTEDVVVALPREMSTPFENTVEELTLSPFLFDGDDRPDDGSARSATPTEDGFTFTFARQAFTYTALGIQKA